MATQRSGSEKTKPASIIQYLDTEVPQFKANVTAFEAEEMDPTAFRSFRLRLGVYGQRQADVHMMRIKIPGGFLHADQVDALAEIIDRFAPLRKGHVTTRENIQIHHLTLENSGEVMAILDSVGLSTRDACGNTVRNVTACPMAGADPQQAFDVQPYMGAFVRSFVRRDFTFQMPRKVKPAFSCGDHDCATVGMHDLGFIARWQDVDGTPRKGFKVVVGGGTSIHPLVAQTVFDFVPVEDFIRVSEAILRVFNATDWLRRNLMKARIKELLHKDGVEAFRESVERELEQDWAQDYPSVEDILFIDSEMDDVPPLPDRPGPQGQDDPAFLAWKGTNVFPQVQDGYRFVGITVVRGDMTPEHLRGVADIARRFASHRVRTTPEQNLMLRWVPEASLFDVYRALTAIGLGDGGYNGITDVTSCPGTDTCKLGITSSMGVNLAVHEALKSPNGRTDLLTDPLVQGLHIKMSGCPNGCARHHMADIGFHGASMRGHGGGQVPAYELFVGGSQEGNDLRYGIRPRGRVPAKRVPEATFQILEHYRANRNDGELFKDFAARVGREPFEAILAGLAEVGPLGRDTLDLYMDYQKSTLYKMERGEGECAV
jgi:sulfite reductase beta subunit-like hemoprotein